MSPPSQGDYVGAAPLHQSLRPADQNQAWLALKQATRSNVEPTSNQQLSTHKPRPLSPSKKAPFQFVVCPGCDVWKVVMEGLSDRASEFEPSLACLLWFLTGAQPDWANSKRSQALG